MKNWIMMPFSSYSYIISLFFVAPIQSKALLKIFILYEVEENKI